MRTAVVNRTSILAAALLAAAVGTALAAGAHDWPGFRGPARDGVSKETGWAAAWPAEGPRKLWEAKLGPGASSVAVANGRLYSMGNVKDHDIVYCLKADTGEEIWRFAYPCPLDKRSFEGGPAGTPTVDGDLVYTISHRGLLLCLNVNTGKEVWRKDFPKDFGGKRPQWGWAGSALVDGEHLIVDAGGPGASTVALNKKTGEVVWKSGDDESGYSSPILATFGDLRHLLVFKAKHLVSLDPADGKERWRFECETSYDVNAAVPIPVAPDKVFLSTGYSRGRARLLQVAPTSATLLWETQDMKNQVNTSVVHAGHAFGITGQLNGGGKLTCVDLKNGTKTWLKDGTGTGTLILADGKLIIVSEKGELILAAADPSDYKELARVQVLGGKSWVSPVLSHGLLYAKNNQGDLVCLDLRGK